MMNNLIKTKTQITKIKIAGDVVAQILAVLYKMIVPGCNGIMLANKAKEIMTTNGCESNFLNYGGFPNVICVSVNEQIIHGIPNKKSFQEGDLVSVDVGCKYQGMHADAALTKIVEKGKEVDQDLLNKTKASLELVIKHLKAGMTVGDVGFLISNFIYQAGYYLNDSYGGHGIGTSLHEKPSISNFGVANKGMILQPNMVICVEPMVLIGGDKIKLLSDCWTVVTENGANSCHFEHMLLITKEGCENLTDYQKYLRK